MQLQSSLENQWILHVRRGMQKKHRRLQSRMQRLPDVLHREYATETQSAYDPASKRGMLPGEQPENIRLFCETLRDTLSKSNNKTYRWRGA